MNLHAKAFLDAYGEPETEKVCERAGTSLVYFKQVVKGQRNFSRALAERLEQASDGRMERVALVFGQNPPPPTSASDART